MCNIFFKVDHSVGDDNDVNWNTDDEVEIDNFQFYPSSSPVHSMNETLIGRTDVSICF